MLPIVLVLIVTGAGMGYYYWRVTGSPFRMTYQVNRGTYATAPYFLWQSPRPEPAYNHAVMRDFYRWELARFEEYHTLAGAADRTWDKVLGSWKFYCGPLLTIPLLAFPWMVRDRKMRFAILAGVFFLLGLAVETWTMPHYVAPATGLIYLVLVQCMRHLRLWRWHGQPVGVAAGAGHPGARLRHGLVARRGGRSPMLKSSRHGLEAIWIGWPLRANWKPLPGATWCS